MRNSIRWAMVRWYGLLILGILIAFGGLLYWQVDRLTWRNLDADLLAHAEAISAALVYDVEDGWELEVSHEYLRGLSETANCTILGPDGEVLYHKGVQPLVAGKGVLGVSTVGDLRAFELEGHNGARIRIGTPITLERQALERLLVGLLASGFAVLLAGLYGGWCITNLSLLPVRELTRAAARVGPRDLTTRLDSSSAPEELRALSEAFNEGLDRLALGFDARRKFTANAAHELRTPITTLRAQAESALLCIRTSEEYRATLKACVRASERMSGLVDGLLELASLEGHDGLTTCGDVELRGLVASAAKDWAVRADEAAVVLACEADSACVRGDRRLLANVLDNLIENSLRHSKADGRVDVLLRDNGENAVLSVSDCGTGIPPEALPHIFDRFYRAHATKPQGKGGFGLGLAITRRIVEVHGGAISVESKVGAGSTFTVRLPMIQSPRVGENS